jgi:hypothetical protein
MSSPRLSRGGRGTSIYLPLRLIQGIGISSIWYTNHKGFDAFGDGFLPDILSAASPVILSAAKDLVRGVGCAFGDGLLLVILSAAKDLLGSEAGSWGFALREGSSADEVLQSLRLP